MKLDEVLSNKEPITPKIEYSRTGDGGWAVRVEYRPDKVYVHINKKLQILEKLVKDRYGPKVFVD